MCYGMCNCGPGMHWGLKHKEWSKEDKLKALEKYERYMQDELKDIQELREKITKEK
jgi:protease II